MKPSGSVFTAYPWFYSKKHCIVQNSKESREENFLTRYHVPCKELRRMKEQILAVQRMHSCVREKGLDTCADCEQMDECPTLGQIAVKGKLTCIRPYKMFCHPNGLLGSQVWSPSRWFSRWSDLGRNMVGGQVSYRPLRCNSHGVQMYRILIQNKIRYNVKAQLLLWMNGRCTFYIWHQVIDWQEDAYTINFI